MDNRNRGNVQKKNTTGGIITAVIIIIVINLINMAGESGSLDFYFIIGIIVFLAFAAVIIGIVAAVIKTIQKNSVKEEKFKFHNKHDVDEDKVYIPLQDKAPKRSYYDSNEVFDNRQHDKEQRIAQLKVFLKNGIIEKEEYNILLERYERES